MPSIGTINNVKKYLDFGFVDKRKDCAFQHFKNFN